MILYVDDTSLYFSAPTIGELNSVLSNDLNAVSDWVTSNRLVLNILKTKSIVFGPHHSLGKNPTLDLQILGQSIKQDEKVRLLGITISNRLLWSDHINQILTKMGRSIAAVRKCAHYLTPEMCRQVVQTLVLCHLDYFSVIWASAPKSELIKLQTDQNRAARLTLNCSYRLTECILVLVG